MTFNFKNCRNMESILTTDNIVTAVIVLSIAAALVITATIVVKEVKEIERKRKELLDGGKEIPSAFKDIEIRMYMKGYTYCGSNNCKTPVCPGGSRNLVFCRIDGHDSECVYFNRDDFGTMTVSRHNDKSGKWVMSDFRFSMESFNEDLDASVEKVKNKLSEIIARNSKTDDRQTV